MNESRPDSIPQPFINPDSPLSTTIESHIPPEGKRSDVGEQKIECACRAGDDHVHQD